MSTAIGKIQLKDKVFRPYISEERITEAVANLADRINSDLKEKNPLFIVVLNGSFMFAADLLRRVTIPCSLSFIKLASYHGTQSSGSVNELIGLSEEIKNRTVVVIEDIVDTGNTLERIFQIMSKKEVSEVKVASLLFKPEAYNKGKPVDYAGFEIPNDFVVGYGLDYDGLGRNLPSLYVVDSE
jgi:hypoxanthine phosphoribosyltransferase